MWFKLTRWGHYSSESKLFSEERDRSLSCIPRLIQALCSFHGSTWKFSNAGSGAMSGWDSLHNLERRYPFFYEWWYQLPCGSWFSKQTFFFFLQFYLLIHERQWHRQRERQAPYGEPDVELDSRTPGSWPELKADTQPLSHPGILMNGSFMPSWNVGYLKAENVSCTCTYSPLV